MTSKDEMSKFGEEPEMVAEVPSADVSSEQLDSSCEQQQSVSEQQQSEPPQSSSQAQQSSSSEPPQSSLEPPQSSSEPPQSPSEPPQSSSQAQQSSSSEPLQSSSEPLQSSSEPLQSSSEPQQSSSEPQQSSTDPPQSSLEPPQSSSEQQPSLSEQLESSCEQMESSGEQMESSGEQMESSGEQMESSGEQMESSGEQMESSGEQMELSGEQMESFCEEEQQSSSTQQQRLQEQEEEQLQEPVDPNACIIIHPGSRFLRVGRPSDSVPYTVLHAIARRQRNTSDNKKRVDPFIVPMAKMSSERLQEVEDCRLKTSRILQSSLMSDGTKRFATPPKQLSSHNRRVSPLVDDTSDTCPPLLHPTEEFVVGDQVTQVSPQAPYHVHFPWQRGDLNTHGGLGGSTSAVMADLHDIWTQTIEDKLKIPASDFKNYRCCVVIPDLYQRDHVALITDLLLNTMGFAAFFVFQDHVAATFGSGLGAACVVDVGDQKTSVSCVEEGLSIPSTRLRLHYGGSDVCQVLHWLLREGGFPRPLEPETSTSDASLLYSLKHSVCHLDLDQCGPKEHQFRVQCPGSKPVLYTLQLGDERLIAPLSLNYPGLLQLTGEKTFVLTQPSNTGHSEDPFDDNYLRETSRRGGRETTEVVDASGGGEGGDDDMVAVEEAVVAGNGRTETSINSLLSLEQAILASIERCSEEVRRRMYATVLLVGAGASFPHFGKWLEGRLMLQIPVIYRPEQVEVITRAKELEPGMIAWKGAALMTGLEGGGELWISKAQWRKLGVRVLREKCPFHW